MGAFALTTSRSGNWAAQCALLSLAVLTLAACASGPPKDLGAGGAPTSRFSAHGTGKPYQVNGIWYYPKEQPNYDEIGIASWYGEQFHNRYTADGEVFDMNIPSAAHKTLPLPSLVEVTNLANGRTVIVRVNDRGPFVDGRMIDLSRAAAAELGFVAAGVTRVRVRYVGHADDPPELKTLPAPGAGPRLYQASAPKVVPAPAPMPQQAASNLPATAAPAPAPPPASISAASPLPDVDSLLADQSVAPNPATADVALPVSGASPTQMASTGAAAPAAIQPAGGYEVQAGIFSSEAAAQRIASGLSGAGLPEVQTIARGGQTLYRVVVHGFTNPTDADATRGAAVTLGVRDARVVTLSGGA